MAKRTAVIDLGSKSFRLVIFEKSSRFGFFIIKEAKAIVGIGKNIHQNKGILQKEDFTESIAILKQFQSTISSLKARKTLCVATSIIRNAPNKNEFKNVIFKQTGLKIKIIDGESEARLGALATLNLLPTKNFITMDTGGGSTEISLVVDKKIKQNISLDMGTVRLNSIFGKENFNKKNVNEYINNLIDKIPKHFYNHQIVAFGGTARAIAKTILPENHPIPIIHGFEFKSTQLLKQYEKIISSNTKELLQMGISSSRVDDIKMGVTIFATIVKRLNIKQIITSRVGIREGVFLNDMLRNDNGMFPKNFHIGMRSLEDRFAIDKILLKNQKKHIYKLFDTLTDAHKIDEKYKQYLSYAISISQSGSTYNIHKINDYSSYIITHSTIYGLNHNDKLILSNIMKYSNKKLIKEKEYIKYNEDYPSYQTIYWLSFMHMLIARIIFDGKKTLEFNMQKDTLIVSCKNTKEENTIEKQLLSQIEIPSDIKVQIK